MMRIKAGSINSVATPETIMIPDNRTPTVRQGTVRQIELVPLSMRRVLCVLIANHEEMFASHVVELQEPMSRDEAAALVRFINTQLVGLPFNEVVSALERRLLAERDSFYLATATADGQPYLQHRGGSKGFLRVIDERTLGIADFGGQVGGQGRARPARVA